MCCLRTGRIGVFGILHPLVGMAYIQFYVLIGVLGHDLLPEFPETLVMILGVMNIPGMILGITAVNMAKKKIAIPAEHAVSGSR